MERTFSKPGFRSNIGTYTLPIFQVNRGTEAYYIFLLAKVVIPIFVSVKLIQQFCSIHVFCVNISVSIFVLFIFFYNNKTVSVKRIVIIFFFFGLGFEEVSLAVVYG